MRNIKLITASFEDALRAMEFLVPTAGIENVCISPCSVGNGWFVDIKDHGIGLAEMVETKMISTASLECEK